MQADPHEHAAPAGSDEWFKHIVKTIQPSHPQFPGHCPDRYAGLIANLKGKADWSDAARGNPAMRPPSPCVLLVMESPHIDEYSPKFFYTPWPANGPTGKRIRQRIAAADLPITTDTGLVLMNAIPFQCSLGISPIGKDRDAVFRLAWEHGGRAFFQSRLMHWYRGGDLVVNACTVGKDGGRPLRDEVEDAIADVVPHALRFRRYHPFSWFNSARASSTWEPKAGTPQLPRT